MKFISLLLSFLTVLGLSLEGVKYGFRPTIEVDASCMVADVSSRASGYLYGIAQNGVPSELMCDSLDISSVSQKVAGGLQHPVGDVDDVYTSLDECDYIVVYLQDCFDTWYYCHDEISSLRSKGEYDCESFVNERFLPEVEKSVRELSGKPYADRLVYCPYNECDNAIWFGTDTENGPVFDEQAKQRFYSAWDKTCELIKSIAPDAVIGGPGYCDYDDNEIRDFLSYCEADVMIYHELSYNSAVFWQDHVDSYRAIEKELGIAELPIIVTEYACPDECGNPASMLQYIVKIEQSGVYGNVAFWRLANNLCDTAANSNTPNSNWWLYRWYAEMDGSLLSSKIIDITHSDFENTIKYNRDAFHYTQLTGIASMNEAQDEIDVICGGSDYTGYICFKNLNKTSLGNKVDVKIECVYFEGLSGEVYKPVTVKQYTDKAVCGRLKVELENMDPTAVYHVVITRSDGQSAEYENTLLPVRYEFEQGTLLANAYTYDSGCATTGLDRGMVGGLENEGDGVRLAFDIPEDGYYDLSVIFGNANDGATPDDRTYSSALMTVDDDSQSIALPNTIRSEYTDSYVIRRHFEKGSHEIAFAHESGTFVLDSLLVRASDESNEITVLEDDGFFIAVAPADGCYKINTANPSAFTVDEAKVNGTQVYLRRGLNKIETDAGDFTITREGTMSAIAVKASEMSLFDGASLESRNGTEYLSNISSDGGRAEFTVNSDKERDCRMTICYSNNEEGGVHAYNVDLIERYVTVSVGGISTNVWCANTFSWDTYSSVTVTVKLNEGENVISLTNNGENTFNSRTAIAPHISECTLY